LSFLQAGTSLRYSKEVCMPTIRYLPFLLLTAILAVTLQAAEPMALDVLANPGKNALVYEDKTSEHGRCLVVDVRDPVGRACKVVSEPLAPGIYQAVVRLKFSPLGTEATANLRWTIAVEPGGAKTFDILTAEKAHAYQDFVCRFTLTRPGPVTITLDWKRGEGRPGSKDDLRAHPSDLKPLEDPDDAGPAVDAHAGAGPAVDTLDYVNMAIAGITIRPVGDLEVSNLEVDKIHYRPGEAPAVSVTVRNYAPRARNIEAVTELLTELDTVIPVDKRQLTVPASGAAELTCKGPVLTQPWGYAVHTRLLEDGATRTEASEYFTMHDNMWACMMIGTMPGQCTRDVTVESARACALSNKKHYGNFAEHFVWAPDDFGDYTPDTEYWYGGQGCYAGSIRGTHAMIDEGHKVGMTYALYANLWGGGGPPSYEMIRRHPDWGKPSFYNTEWMERWGKDPGMHVWIMCNNNYDNPAPFHWHAKEIIATHRIYGWDAIRYDSYTNIQGDDPKLRLVKADVAKVAPEVQWGYNTIVPGSVDLYPDAFRELCRNGGLIMDEGARGYGMSKGSYEDLARRLLLWSTDTRRFGGHLTAIGQDKCYANDYLYQYVFWLAANTHPWFGGGDGDGPMPNYRRFATRYAGLIFDLAVTPVPDAMRWIDLGDKVTSLYLFPEYVRQRDLGNGQRQLILQFVNPPVATHLWTDETNVLPLPRDPFSVKVTLPGAAKVRNVWHLTAEPVLTQAALPFEVRGRTVTFTAPRLRFWNMVVLDLDGAGPEFAVWTPPVKGGQP
jgi:hypothetical protein